jgi:hypothetical protein
MLRTLILLVIGCSAIINPASAQHLPGNASGAGTGLNITDHMLIKESRRGLEGESEEKVDGTPYQNENFVKGTVYSSKGKFPDVMMRYNIYADQIEFKQKDITYILDPGPDIKKIDLGDHLLVVEKYEVKGKSKSGFYTLLDSGKVTLVAKKVVTYREAQAPKALEIAGKPAKYSKAGDEFLYRIGDGPLMEVGSIKKFVENFPDRQEELMKFVSQEKISKNEKELIKLVRYYNSL